MTVGADSAFFDLAAGGIDGVGVDFERVVGELKPGAHLLALSPIATHHSNTISIEDAGMEIRDTVVWVFDSGGQTPDMLLVTVARKPLEGTVAENTLKYGTGGLNIDQSRIRAEGTDLYFNRSLFQGRYEKKGLTSYGGEADWKHGDNSMPNSAGRWPANLAHDGSDEVVGLFPDSKSCSSPSKAKPESKFRPGQGNYQPQGPIYPGDSGSAARFFYSAPCLDSLITYLLKLITQPNGTVLTNCDKEKLPNDYNYVGQEL